MATIALIPGAGSDSWFWHLVVPELERRGQDVVTMDLPCDDDSAGFEEYADVVVDAIGNRTERGDVVLVAQSMGSFTALLVCERIPVRLLVLVNAMTPTPGETGGEWWASTGLEEDQRAYAEEIGIAPGMDDVEALFFHDVPADITAEAMRGGEKDQSGTPFERPYPITAWPDVPTRFLLARDDRMFPAAFQRRVVKERLGFAPDEMDGGHLTALSRPAELAERLDAYARDAGVTP
jgi:pimeloyl-ACP methyl ester carboxylesterase